MARFAYSLLLYLLLPAIWLRLLWRARQQPDYLRHLGERFGFYGTSLRGPVIWVHAVSVGETRAAEPLIAAIRVRWPECRILLTCMTPTGREAGRSVYGDRVFQAYLPYDFPGAVDRFLERFSPIVGILMETEIWPNLLAAASRRDVPVLLANARLSRRSARGYSRIGALVRPALTSLEGVAAQTRADAQRLAILGARQVIVCGNLKFDVAPPWRLQELGLSWRAAVGGRPVWVAASTREGEEALILAEWRRRVRGDALLVIVPRHPQRFPAVAEILRQGGWRSVSRSLGVPGPDTEIWLGDSMGELAAYYTLADVAFVGGSLLPFGGQNLIEAAACGCPVLVGPHSFNFRQATLDAIRSGAAECLPNAEALVVRALALIDDVGARRSMQRAADDFAAAHRGATRCIVAALDEVMAGAGRMK